MGEEGAPAGRGAQATPRGPARGRIALTLSAALVLAVGTWFAVQVTSVRTCMSENTDEPGVYPYSPSRHICQSGWQAGDLPVLLPVLLGPLALVAGSFLRGRARPSGYALYALAAFAPFVPSIAHGALPKYVIGEHPVFYDGRLLRVGYPMRAQLCFAHGPERFVGERLASPGGPPQLCLVLRPGSKTASVERACASEGRGELAREVQERLRAAGLQKARRGDVSLEGLAARPLDVERFRWMPDPGALLLNARPRLLARDQTAAPRAVLADLRRRKIPHTVWPRVTVRSALPDSPTSRYLPLSLPGDAVRLIINPDGSGGGAEQTEGRC